MRAATSPGKALGALSPSAWKEARASYVDASGLWPWERRTSLAQVAREHGLPYRELRNRARREGWALELEARRARDWLRSFGDPPTAEAYAADQIAEGRHFRGADLNAVAADYVDAWKRNQAAIDRWDAFRGISRGGDNVVSLPAARERAAGRARLRDVVGEVELLPERELHQALATLGETMRVAQLEPARASTDAEGLRRDLTGIARAALEACNRLATVTSRAGE